MITIRVQGELRGRKLERWIERQGYAFKVKIDPSRAAWREYTLNMTTGANGLRDRLKKVLGGGAVSVTGDGAINRKDQQPEWRQREAARRRAARDEKKASREEWVKTVRASGHMEFSVFGRENREAVEEVLDRMPGSWTVRRGGSWWVYTVQCTWEDNRMQQWLNETFPGIKCKVVRV